jgi:hypothetical protein
MKKKAQPLPFIKGRTKKEGGKTKVLTLNKYMAMGPSGARCQKDRAGWLPAVSYCSALLCSALLRIVAAEAREQASKEIATGGS